MIKVGILFSGNSREREIAFAGGRTVYDNLDKSIFEPIPIFIDSHLNFILLDWQYLYKGSIRDFYPPVIALTDSPNAFQIYIESLGILSAAQQEKIILQVGRKVTIDELPNLIDIAFLALHGNFGEDGQLQGLLESLQIPYTGSGIRASAIGMDKSFQKKMMEIGGFANQPVVIIPRASWLTANTKKIFKQVVNDVKYPIVVRPANQGSSIGITIVGEKQGERGFIAAVNKAFFIENIFQKDWSKRSHEERVEYVRHLTDIRESIGLPVDAYCNNATTTIYHPEHLLTFLNENLAFANAVTLYGHLSEQKVVVEGFIQGREFSCVVIQDEDGTPIALPPTEIVKGKEVFDYRAKYLPGLSRKITPIDLPTTQIEAIRNECERLFRFFEFNVYARIDGFINAAGTIFLNDPNTTSGMLPSSFFFHQAAEIGLNPSQFLTYIIRTSLQERIRTVLHKTDNYNRLLQQLSEALKQKKTAKNLKQKVGVIMGGYSYERHISVESGRNIYEKLAGSDKYEPIPIFLSGNAENYTLYKMPITLLFKDNADDIRDKIAHFKKHAVIEKIKKQCSNIIQTFAATDVIFEPQPVGFKQLAKEVDVVFIALHGRPGEDGALQNELEKVGLSYNGSGVSSSAITIDKYQTLQLLKKQGFVVADQLLIYKKDYNGNYSAAIQTIEHQFDYPLIAKPVDDGCSSAVKVIKNQAQLKAYIEGIFRDTTDVPEHILPVLQLKPKEEFPTKPTILIESLITANGAARFMEVTGGLLTHYDKHKLTYEMFEPSEALSAGEVLSLEEKFLAGEGQNITPARFGNTPSNYKAIAEQVKADLQRAAEILQVEGYARIDAFVRIAKNNKAETVIVEVNSLPGMTPATCIFHQAAINGYKPYQFIDEILTFAQARKRK
ncbi:MAG: D-alanine--D-alanine ligase [Saprospiraceae bacterium]|nr:D-alanine--D-alanine ligase [Saprospiraceae bacterium]MBP7679780.1 D-alanine--D-alanine ligase [Saprospiraceae bacterium]